MSTRMTRARTAGWPLNGKATAVGRLSTLAHFSLSAGSLLGLLVLSPGSVTSPPTISWSIGSIAMIFSMLALLSLAVTGLALINPRTRAKLKGGRNQADQWIEAAIQQWVAEGRITEREAQHLQAELAEPQFHAVLPHFGVHLTISVFLRFPLGSMARAGYTLGNFLLGHARFALRRIDHAAWQRSNRTHSPLVILIAAIPGFGAIAYLASRSVRSHPLLLRVGLDAICQKIPRRLYERSGLHIVIARRPAGMDGASANKDGVAIRIRPARFIQVLVVAATALVLLDVVMEVMDSILNHPSMMGWAQIMRILDLNQESSLGTWLAVTSLLVITATLGVIALWERTTGGPYVRHWLGLTLITGGLSIDEQAQLHDPGGGLGAWARERLPLEGVLYFGWVIFAMLSIGAIFILYRHFISALPPATRVSLFLAASLYTAGELGLEMASGWWIDRNGRGLTAEILTSGEEFLGLMGLVAAISALLGFVQQKIGDIRISLGNPASLTTVFEDTGSQALSTIRLQAQPSPWREVTALTTEVHDAPAQSA